MARRSVHRPSKAKPHRKTATRRPPRPKSARKSAKTEKHTPLFRVQLALSLDGYIAAPDGSVKWLDPYFTPEIDFMGFMSKIGAVVMGHTTYEQAIAMTGWHYSGMRAVVLARKPLSVVKPDVEVWGSRGETDIRALADDLRASLKGTGKDIWLMGGGTSLVPFHEAGLVDRWELSFIPVILGGGIPLFQNAAFHPAELRLTHSRILSNGISEVWYEPADRR